MRIELEPLTTAIPTIEHSQSIAQEADPSAEAREALHQGIKAAQAGNRSEARAALLRATELDPKSENAWLWLASISEFPEELLVFLNNVLDINPNNERAIEWAAATRSLLAKTFVQRGIDAVQDNQSEYAAKCFNQALEFDQSNSMAWLWMASLCDSNEGKITYLERVLSIDPQNEAAAAELSSAKAQITANLLAEAKAAAVAGRAGDAMELLDAIIAESPNSEEAWILRSHLAESFEEKIRCFDRVLELDPDHTVARAGRQSLLAIIGDVRLEPNVEDQASHIDPPQNALPTNVPIEEAHYDKNPTQDLELPPAILEESAILSAGVLRDISESPDFGLIPDYENDHAIHSTEEPVIAVAQEVARPDEEAFENSDGNIAVSFEPAIDDAAVFLHEPVDASYTNGSTSDPDDDPVSSIGIPMPSVELEIPQSPAKTGFETHVEPVNIVPEAPANYLECPFCLTDNDAQAISCKACLAVLTLSDLEMLLANQDADKLILKQAIEKMKQRSSEQALSEEELKTLAIGCLNLRDVESGFSYLQQASRLNPNNVVLSSQVNALHIRLEEIKEQQEAHERMPKGKTILVVDDSPTVRKLIAGKLEKCGHEVFCSNDGVEAMELLADLRPDLVLLDITMPRMDGYQVCKLIRNNSETKDVPVVMISGKDGFFDKVRGRMAGTTGYITKPFGPETLMKAVETYLKGEPAEINE